MFWENKKIYKDRKPLIIGINTTSAVAGGGVTYLNNLIKWMSACYESNRYYIYSKQESVVRRFDSTQSNCKWVACWFPSISPLFRVFWEQFILPLRLKRDNVHMLICPANIGLLFFRFPFVVVVQNMAVFDDDFIKHEKKVQKLRLYLLRVLTVRSMKRAKKVIFISKFAQMKVCKEYNIETGKTALVYHGRDERFSLPLNEQGFERVKDKYKIDKYILYVSNIYRYKNFYELVLAFLKIKDQIDSDIELVLAGVNYDDAYYNKIKKLLGKCGNRKSRVRFVGHVSNDLLPFLYANAMFFVYPSTIENCPNILIEAMGCGSAIISSNIEPMPEICQDASLYFDPYDPGDIGSKMIKMIKSKELRMELSERALERARYFSWERSAKETLDLLDI